MNSVEAYPLHWPAGRPRTKTRQRANFHRRESFSFADGTPANWKRKAKLTVADSRDRVRAELTKLGASQVVISSNLRLRQDGLPMSAQREPEDPGVAVYFQLNKLPHCLSCDTWDRAADNLAAIAKHVEAMRGQIRWGVADVAAMFAGFKALPGAIITPAAMTLDAAALFVASQGGANHGQVISSRATFDAAYREAVKKLHPDRNGGHISTDWHTLQEAADLLEQHHGGRS